MKVIDGIIPLSSLEELEVYIQGLFNIDGSYIPAIINEGTFTVDKGEDFYLKLVLAHHKVNYNKTWLKDNLSFGIIDPDFGFKEDISFYDLLVENVITLRQVKGNSLYQLNPNINSDSIEEYEYDNNVLVNAYYNDEFSKGKGNPVLKSRDNKNLFVIQDVLIPYLNEAQTNTYPKYKLVAEYEFRTHNNLFPNLNSGFYNTNIGIHEIYKAKGNLIIQGSMDIILPKKSESKPREIRVIDLVTGRVKPHNPGNFDDDINAGFVVFKKEIIQILRDRYYFYDLVMFDKTKLENSYLIDILSDKVVFWEGEYNKLPSETKNLIDKYNFVPSEIKNIISPGMKAWQLDVDWNYNKKLYPEQILASKIRENNFNYAIEVGINFLIPESVAEFRDFIEKVNRITNITLAYFDKEQKDVQTLKQISNGENVILNDNEMELLFRKYCYQIFRVMNNV